MWGEINSLDVKLSPVLDGSGSPDEYASVEKQISVNSFALVDGIKTVSYYKHTLLCIYK